MLKCVVIEDEPLALNGIKQDLRRIPFVQLEGGFENAMEAIPFLINKKVDLVLSDIKMPGINGVELLKSLPKRPLFVFITGIGDYALESYDLEVFDYIMKPYSFPRLLKTLTRAKSLLSQSETALWREDDHLNIKEKYRNYLVPYNQIQYIEGDKEYIRISTLDREFYIIHSLKKIQEDLPDEVFIRVHKSYIINKGYIKAIDPDKIIMKGSIKGIPLGVTYRDEVYKKLIPNN